MGIVAFTSIQCGLKYLSSYLSIWTGCKITNALKFDMFKKLLTFPSSFSVGKNSGDVVFPVNENSKWKLQSVYDEFSSNEKYNTKILLTIADYDIYCSKEHRKNKLYQNLDFFKKRNIKAELALQHFCT